MYGRPPSRLLEIAAELRRRIVGGVYKPGEQMPIRSDLEAEFGAGSGTIQRVFNRLSTEGFIRSEGRHGTFVSQRPPHLSRYGVVFSNAPDDGSWTQFHVAALNEALRLAQQPDLELETYFRVDHHADSPDFARLQEDLCRDRLAGLAFPMPPFELYYARKLPLDDVPCVAILAPKQLGTFSSVQLGTGYRELILETLRESGCRRIAVFGNAGPGPDGSSWEEVLADAGLETRPHWIHGICLCPHGRPEGARVAELLMHTEPRPDAVLILDDNLVEPVTRGLAACEGRIPDEVLVVAHCNFPWPTPSSVPVTRIGYDMHEVLTAMLDLLRRRANGRRRRRGSVRIAAIDECEHQRRTAVRTANGGIPAHV